MCLSAAFAAAGLTKWMMQKGRGYDSLCQFLTKEMPLPFVMHAVHRNFMLAVHQTPEPLDLHTFLTTMARVFPFEGEWMIVAADTADLYSTRGHFVEKSDQAGHNT